MKEIYMTNTLSPIPRQEAESCMDRLLEQYPEFALDDIADRLCPQLREYVAEKGCLQLLPGVHKSDGFFITRLVRGRGHER